MPGLGDLPRARLASAERMPAPVRFVTFDPGQLGLALGLGLDVVSA